MTNKVRIKNDGHGDTELTVNVGAETYVLPFMKEVCVALDDEPVTVVLTARRAAPKEKE